MELRRGEMAQADEGASSTAWRTELLRARAPDKCHILTTICVARNVPDETVCFQQYTTRERPWANGAR